MVRKIQESNQLTVFAISVLPVPEGPAIKKLAIGRFGLDSPLLDRRIAFATALTASVCPTTLSARIFSMRRSFSFSVDMSLVTGIEVHLATISAICSVVTELESESSISVIETDAKRANLPLPPSASSSAAFLASRCSRRVCSSGIA